mgnify:FL=1
MNPWRNKDQNKIQAQKHKEECERLYADEIKRCIEESKVHTFGAGRAIPDFEIKKPVNTEIILDDTDSVTALYNCNENEIVAILNFASYKNPGGMFLKGSMAQEEALCHESILYNVLSAPRFQEEFYGPNHNRLNRGMYGDDLIYSRDVLFIDPSGNTYGDVITCAAPNAGVASEICHVKPNIIKAYLKARIQHVLYIALKNDVDVVILGAYGCGVFKNDPYDVAAIFKDELDTTFEGAFDKIIFAIPDSKSNNYKAFQDILFG